MAFPQVRHITFCSPTINDEDKYFSYVLVKEEGKSALALHRLSGQPTSAFGNSHVFDRESEAIAFLKGLPEHVGLVYLAYGWHAWRTGSTETLTDVTFPD